MDAEKLIGEIDQFSNHKLKRKDDLKTLVEMSEMDKKEKVFENLTFTAKYVLGLQRVLKKGSGNSEIKNLENIKEDYSKNLMKSIDQVRDLVSNSPVDIKNHFDKTYFELSHQSLQNLNELLEDLEWTKIYLNRQKRTNPIS